MRLNRLKIENFRGITSLEIELDRDITVLIGENNSGKTTVLEALRFGLETIKSDKTCNFSEHDFHRNGECNDLASSKPIQLTFYFAETEEYLWPDYCIQTLNDVIVGSAYAMIKLQLTAQYVASDANLTQSWCFLDDADNEMLGKQGLLKDLRRLRPFFFQTALRSAKDEFHGQSTYWSSFLKNKDIDEDTRKTLEEELSNVNQKIVDAHTSFKDVTEEVKRISELVSVGKADSVSVDPIAADVYKALRYTEVNLLTGSNAKIPIRSHGEGTQSLSVLLLFSAYMKTRLKADIDKFADPIIAIEEPEAHLHPNAIRALWSLILTLPGQKIIATHSGDILSEVPVDKLRRLNKTHTTTECKSIPNNLLSEEDLRKFNHHVKRNRGELLFAKYWLLVEGETEVSVFVECADILGVNLHQMGIRLIEVSQAGGPSIFIKVADALGIKWHVVADNDEGGQRYITAAKTLLDGRKDADYITKLSSPNTDVLLCRAGYGKPYRDGVVPQKISELTEPVDSYAYWNQVYKIIKNFRGFSKPAAALEAILLMKEQGPDGVPSEIKDILTKLSKIEGDDQ
jgi:putative ATP-dependent endonuclease of OLD family